jgi:uncharacterized protein
MRAALFAPVKPTEPDKIGHLTESAIFSQFQHHQTFRQLRYARWRNEGEVDMVYLSPVNEKPLWVGEIGWSDNISKQYGREISGVTALLKGHPGIQQAFLTTKTINSAVTIENRRVSIYPSALYCYMVGRNITRHLEKAAQQAVAKT